MTLWTYRDGRGPFFAGLVSCEHPFDVGTSGISLLFPGGEFADEAIGVVGSKVEALVAQDAALDRFWGETGTVEA